MGEEKRCRPEPREHLPFHLCVDTSQRYEGTSCWENQQTQRQRPASPGGREGLAGGATERIGRGTRGGTASVTAEGAPGAGQRPKAVGAGVRWHS